MLIIRDRDVRHAPPAVQLRVKRGAEARQRLLEAGTGMQRDLVMRVKRPANACEETK